MSSAERESAGRAPDGATLSSLFQHSLTYSLVPLLGRAISVLMLYFYAKWMHEAEYGTSDLADLLFMALVQLLGANLLGGMTRYYFEHARAEDRAAVVSSCTLVIGGLASLAVGTLLVFRTDLAPILISPGDAIVGDSEMVDVLTIALLIVPLQLASQCGFYYLQILQRSRTYAALQLGKIVFELGLRIWMVGFAGLGVVGYVLPVLIGEATATLIVTGWTLWSTRARFSWAILRPIVAYTLPLIPVGLFQLGLHYADRRLLALFSPAELALTYVGIYGMGYKLGYLVTAGMLGPFIQIFHPWIYGVADPDEQARKLARVSTYAIVAITAASLFVVLLARQGLDLLPEDRRYGEAWRVVPYIATGYTLWAVYHVSQVPLFIAKQTGPLVLVNALALALNIALNAWLVPIHGYVGSGIATMLTFLTLAGLGMLASRGAMRVPFEVGRIALTVAAIAAASFVALEVDGRADLPLAQALAVKLAVGVVALVWLWRGVLRPEERAQ
ncbi:MAG TPA: polysaccharide biosynthesis C-terminal domain-containing protein, partial [Planctomycetota bacterium]|nr:polysaccharide biosynthesis C-terminal domain-containing protein [Planctomycetota bacterium]